MVELKDNMMVEVINNSTGSVSYYSEFSRTVRKWDKPSTIKKISLEELRELVGSSGGYELLENFLLIKDMDVREELGLPVNKEYMLGEKEIKALLKKSVDVLENTLENTSESIKDKIAQIAIETKVSDLDKLEVIKDHTGVDVLFAIQEKKEEEKQEKADKKKSKK
jgi:pyruvate-formate lyase-activating enzyme